MEVNRQEIITENIEVDLLPDKVRTIDAMENTGFISIDPLFMDNMLIGWEIVYIVSHIKELEDGKEDDRI